MSNNLHAPRWTNDPAQQEQFFTAVGPRIHGESKYMAWIYGAGTYIEDIEAEVTAKLWRQMLETDAGGPFAKGSPKEAADCFLEKKNFLIREWARSSARQEADKHKNQSRQAEILAHVGPPDVRQDVETELFAVAKSLPLIISETPGLTPRDSDIVRKEVLRQVGIDDLRGPAFDQVAQAAGVSSSEQRAYNKYHDEHGHLSPSDRKAWSRVRAKVAKALTRAKLTSLLAIVCALSVALLDATRQGRSINQNDFVNQGSLIDAIASGHQRNSTQEIASGHQRNSTQEIASGHQRNSTREALTA